MAHDVMLAKNHAMNIGCIIREIRQAKGLTLEDVAYDAGTDGGNLSRIERGRQRCIPELLERIAAALSVPVSELYLRAESGRSDAEHQIQQIKAQYTAAPVSPEDVKLAGFLSKFQKLSPGNQALATEFIQMLLRHQRQK